MDVLALIVARRPRAQREAVPLTDQGVTRRSTTSSIDARRDPEEIGQAR
jgi:hypothetical protein